MGFWDDHPDLYEQGGFAGGAGQLGDLNYATQQGAGQAPDGQQGTGSTAAGLGQVTQAMAPTAGSAHDSTQGGMTREQYRDAWQGSGATSMADLQRFVQAHGGTINSGNGTVTTPYGEQIDMLQGARTNGNGHAAWGGIGGDAGGGGPVGMSGMGPGMMFSSMGPGGGGQFGGGGSAGGPGGVAGGWDGKQFQYGGDFTPGTLSQQDIARPGAYTSQQFAMPGAFKAPTAADMQQDPSYQFRLQQGTEALQASKAAQGLLRSGNTLTDLTNYAQGAASQEYGNVYARKQGEYQNAFGNALAANGQNNQTAAQAYDLTNRYQQNADLANQQNRFQVGQANIQNGMQAHGMNAQNQQAAWQGNVNAQLGQGNLTLGNKQADNSYGLGMANVGLGYHSADQSYDLGLRNNALGYTQAANSYSLGQGNLGLGWANYGLNADQQNFNQGFSLANMGYGAAGQSGAFGGQYGANAGGYYTGQGAANAAGQMGQANAWGGAFNGAANTGLGAYYANQYGRQPSSGGGMTGGEGFL